IRTLLKDVAPVEAWDVRVARRPQHGAQNRKGDRSFPGNVRCSAMLNSGAPDLLHHHPGHVRQCLRRQARRWPAQPDTRTNLAALTPGNSDAVEAWLGILEIEREAA